MENIKCKNIKCMQINMQHSRVATANLLKITEDSPEILCIREPYTIQNKIAGIPKNSKFSHQVREETRQQL